MNCLEPLFGTLLAWSLFKNQFFADIATCFFLGGTKFETYWNLTNRMTVEMFKAFWQQTSPYLEFPLTQAGGNASYAEWEDIDGRKYGLACCQNALKISTVIRFVRFQ